LTRRTRDAIRAHKLHRNVNKETGQGNSNYGCPTRRSFNRRDSTRPIAKGNVASRRGNGETRTSHGLIPRAAYFTQKFSLCPVVATLKITRDDGAAGSPKIADLSQPRRLWGITRPSRSRFLRESHARAISAPYVFSIAVRASSGKDAVVTRGKARGAGRVATTASSAKLSRIRSPSFPSTSTTTTIVRKISHKCVLFCRVERRTTGAHTPGMHYARGPCRGCRPADARFARAFSHVLVSHVARARAMPLPGLSVCRISTWCVRMRSSPSLSLSRFLSLCTALCHLYARLDAILRLGHVARQDGRKSASSHDRPSSYYRDQCVSNLGTLCFGLRVVHGWTIPRVKSCLCVCTDPDATLTFD